MTFDLKKAMENGGKCVVNDRARRIKKEGIIVYQKYKCESVDNLLVVTCEDGNSVAMMYSKFGAGGPWAHLENVPESHEVFIVITEGGTWAFDGKEDYDSFLFNSSESIRSTKKLTITDGEFINNDIIENI